MTPPTQAQDPNAQQRKARQPRFFWGRQPVRAAMAAEWHALSVLVYRRRLAIGFIAVMVAVLLLPGSVVDFMGNWLASLWSTPQLQPTHLPHSDKVGHFLLFLASGFLVRKAWPLQAHWRLLLALVMLGAATEVAQIAIPGRSESVLDGIADAAGAELGLWVGALCQTASLSHRA